mgnify:CR=1 FL=1
MYEEDIHFGKVLLKQTETVLTHLTLVTLTPKSIGLPRTEYEEGRSRHSRVIDRKPFGHI